ncbi:thiamine pyrophosphate-dependent enzyme [Raoultibacter phocaeensis]|uniref:thiamine pyrophosphate-dependent enzyme n=1 Tax=Raoultibacter phocaeensis TaxID=2479841 RepID=UPI001117E253|nr:thiamine pyrophosphate-dependent enzyme [Raoultibacter phocaeensis]
MQKQLLMGNEAFAHAALEAGVRVAAGYPGTPSSEVIETIAAEHAAGRAQGIHVEWSTNEKAALELLAGAAYAGARVLFTAKQVGLNVASDALMSLNYVGVKGGTVLFVADDPGPISSQTEQDTRRFASFAKVPVFDPATPDQGCAMIKAAFELSEAYRTPVIVRPTTRICHASTFFDVPEATVARDVPEEGFERDPKWVIFPRRAFEAHGEINERLVQIAEECSTGSLAVFNPVFEGGGTAADGSAALAAGDTVDNGENAAAAASEAPRLGIMTGGVSAMYAREALSLLAERCEAANVALPSYRFIQVGTPFPFPESAVESFAEGLDQIIVLEELDHVLEDGLLALCGKLHAGYSVFGKLNGYTRDRGENTVDDAYERLARFLGVEEALAAIAACGEDGESPSGAASLAFDGPLPVRPPVLCAGCPHRGSFYAVKRALGKTPAVLCGDIGCYTLGNAMPLDAVDTCLCMGAGITMAQGFSVAEPEKKAIAFVGDSTFFASGLTGIVNAVYNQHDITVVVLDNATTAMTGSQPHPGTGATLMGPKTKPISIENVLRAVGFECIVHANPFKLEESVAAAKEAIEFGGPSAVIYEGPCIQLTKPDAPAAISTDACTGCKRCITEIGCPGIGFDAQATGLKSGKRGQAFVDQSLCDGCGLCVQVCPFHAIELPATEGGCRA